MSTLSEIARSTKLAVTTVSEILRDKPGYQEATRQRVLEAARKLNYRPNLVARQLRGQKSGLIGAIIGAGNAQVNFDRLAALERVAFERGCRLLIGQVHEGGGLTRAYLDDLRGRGVDGLLWLHQPYHREPPVTEDFFSGNRSVVFLDESAAAWGGCVRVDYADGISQAIRHLRTSGRKRIGLVLDGPGWPGNPMAERQRGYRDELHATALSPDPALLWMGEGRQIPTTTQLADAIHRLCGQAGADALLASNDIWAVALIKALRRAGRRVPEDVAVVGFDNLAIADLFEPALTTIDQNHGEFASVAMEMLGQLMDGGELPARRRTVIVKPRLIVRESA